MPHSYLGLYFSASLLQVLKTCAGCPIEALSDQWPSALTPHGPPSPRGQPHALTFSPRLHSRSRPSDKNMSCASFGTRVTFPTLPFMVSVLFLDEGLLQPSRTALMSFYIFTSKLWTCHRLLLFSTNTPCLPAHSHLSDGGGASFSAGGVTHVGGGAL